MLSDDETDQRHWNEADYFDLNAGIRLQLLQPSDSRRGSDNDDFVCVCVWLQVIDEAYRVLKPEMRQITLI